MVHLGRYWSTGFLTLSGLRALILPAITLGLFQMTLIMRLVRAEMLEVLRSDYIKFARARGLSERAINFGHALKNTLVPVITIVGLQFGGIVAFSIVTESVFQWPGMGLLLVQSIAVADIPVMSAYLLLIAVLFVVINLVVDLLYFAVDPRLRVEVRKHVDERGDSPCRLAWMRGLRQRLGLRLPHARRSPMVSACRGAGLRAGAHARAAGWRRTIRSTSRAST